jgi:hypothetical protein
VRPCGDEVASRAGVDKHYEGRRCAVLWPILALAKLDYSEGRRYREELERQAEAEVRRHQTLCVVDLAEGKVPMGGWYENLYGRSDTKFAEDRLSSLGFNKTVTALRDGKTETRRERTTEEAYILADPRQEGRINFRAWPIAEVKAGKLSKHRRHFCPEHLLDGWKNDLDGKLKVRVDRMLTK